MTEPTDTAPTDEAIRAEAERQVTSPLLRGMFLHGAKWAREQTAPTVAPTVGAIMQALARTSGLPEWWTGANFRRLAEAVAAADPRRTEADVKAEALGLRSEHTPDTALVRAAYVSSYHDPDHAEAGEGFDRWLAQVRADSGRRSHEGHDELEWAANTVAELRDRAARLRGDGQ